MNRNQHRKPFYRRPWLWIIVILLLIGSGWFISSRNQAQETQEDAVVKTTKESDKKKKSTKESKIKKKLVLSSNLPAVRKVNGGLR